MLWRCRLCVSGMATLAALEHSLRDCYLGYFRYRHTVITRENWRIKSDRAYQSSTLISVSGSPATSQASRPPRYQ